MTRAQYSFAPPVGFAAVGDSTPPARTLAPARAPAIPATAPPAPLPSPSAGVSAPPALLTSPSAGVSAPPPPLSPPSAGVTAPPSAGHASNSALPTPGAASGWPAELPIGLRQDRERAASREALMRSGAPVRRGSVEEGKLSRLSPHPPRAAVLARESAEPSGEGPVPPAQTPAPAHPSATEPAVRQPAGGIADMEALCEDLIARLRRELVVERERMGTPLGA